MTSWANKLFSAIFGDPRVNGLEQRLFNTVTLLSGASNIVGAWGLVEMPRIVLLLQLGSGVVFLCFYVVSRFWGIFRRLFWPFVLTILVFLFINSLANAASMGGAHYYFITALVIAAIISTRLFNTAMAMTLFCGAVVTLYVVEARYPEWITTHSSEVARLSDVYVNFLFVQVLTAILVVLLSKNLNEERARSDSLLLNILPEQIAAELKQKDQVEPRQYESASVLFTDFVGFTKIAADMTPKELIRELDRCFRKFDEIVLRNKLEKIKTIGDSYMAVGGIPIPNRTHALDSVLAAMQIQSYMNQKRRGKESQDEPFWGIRLGIHSGKLVAGIIGREKFAYDVWGDTVNTASRLESSGVAGRVNISEATYALVEEFFDCEYRGLVAAKNKGEIAMYFVNRLKPAFASDPRGQLPNDDFAARYNEIRALSINESGD